MGTDRNEQEEVGAKTFQKMAVLQLGKTPQLAAIKVKNLGLFRLKDVSGDGNCFFNAIVLSKDLNFECSLDLKNQMASLLMRNKEAKVIYNEVFADNKEEYETFVKGVGRRGKHQSTKAALFICYMFEVNICFITNETNGFQVHDTRQ